MARRDPETGVEDFENHPISKRSGRLYKGVDLFLGELKFSSGVLRNPHVHHRPLVDGMIVLVTAIACKETILPGLVGSWIAHSRGSSTVDCRVGGKCEVPARDDWQAKASQSSVRSSLSSE